MSRPVLQPPLRPFSLARTYTPIPNAIPRARLHLHAGTPAAPPLARVSTARMARSSAISIPTLQHGFHASTTLQKDHHFDTLKFVQRLQAEGFSEEQSEALMRVLSDVIEER
jgi:hypothetical protein